MDALWIQFMLQFFCVLQVGITLGNLELLVS